MLITIPTDSPNWLRLKDSARNDAVRWARLLNARSQAANKAAFDRTVIGSFKGCTRQTIERRYYRALKRGWMACVNWSCASGQRALPALFIEHWIKLCEGYQRDLSRKRAHDKLKQQYRRWRAGDSTAAIPGYRECPPQSATGLPRGWDYTNLCRKLKARQSRAEHALATRGIAAARAFLPHVIQDVSQVRPLEYVVFDDVEIDFLISVPGSFTPVKLRLLVAMDLCSRVILGFGVRPAVTRPDGVEDSLKLRDMKCIVARTLSRLGFPLDYIMTLIVERATATLKEGDIAALNEISQGQIRVSLTSMISGSVFEFQDRSTGNSWGKAWLESFFNYLHNELGDREGQKGRRYDLAPAELHGRSKELATLMRAGQRMPLALRQQLRLPFMSGEEALHELNAAFAKANARTDHALQGFDQVQEWRLDSAHPWAPREELPLLADRLGIALPDLSARAEWNPAPRMESPNERLNRLIGAVARQEVSPAALRLLMDEHRAARFEDFQFSFDYQGKEYIYLPGDALCAQLDQGAKYLVWFDPQEMDRVFLTRGFPHVGWLGELKLFRRTHRGSLDEKKESLREVKHRLNLAARQVASRHPEKFEGAIARAEQNIEILRNVTALEIEVDVINPASPVNPVQDSPAVREMADRLLARAHAREDEKVAARRGRAVVANLTSDDVAAAIGGHRFVDAAEEPEISSEEVSALFAQDNETQTQGEPEW